MAKIKRGEIRMTVGRDTDLFNVTNDKDFEGNLVFSPEYLLRCASKSPYFISVCGKINQLSKVIEAGFDFILKKFNVQGFEIKTFGQKFYNIKKLVETNKLPVENQAIVLDDLSKMVDERNKFIHGTVTFFGEQAILEGDLRDKGHFEEELTETKIHEVEELFGICNKHVSVLIKKTSELTKSFFLPSSPE